LSLLTVLELVYAQFHELVKHNYYIPNSTDWLTHDLRRH